MSFSRFYAAALTAVSACLLAPSAALAATSTTKADPYGETTALDLPSSDPDAGSATSGGGSLVRTFVGLAIVIAVIYGLYWILRQVKAGKEERTVGSGLETAATVPLGPNRALHLVRAGNELVLVGVADHAVTPIRTYTEDEARAAGLLPEEDDEDDDGDDQPGSLVAATGAKRNLRKMTIGEALERVRQATVRS